MAASCLLPGYPTLEWYVGVVVLNVVRGERVLDYLVFNIIYVRNFVEESCANLIYVKQMATCGHVRVVMHEAPSDSSGSEFNSMARPRRGVSSHACVHSHPPPRCVRW
jgi:hypothetical protein